MMTRHEIADFIKDSGCFTAARFEPSPGSRAAVATEWDRLDVMYQEGKQHIVLWLNVHNDMVEGHVEETIESYLDPQKRSALVKELWERLRETYQTITVRVGFGGDEPTEDAWDMLTELEDHIAQTYDGIIWMPQGFYDEKGERLYEIT